MPLDDYPFWCLRWALIIKLICTAVVRLFPSPGTLRISSLCYSKISEQKCPVMQIFYIHSISNWWVFPIWKISPLFGGNVFYNFIVYFLLFLQWLLLEDTASSLFSMSLDFLIILSIRGFCWGCSTHIPSTTLTGFLYTFFSCWLNWCWWFTPKTIGELSLGTCSCFVWQAASSQWLLMWWYKSPQSVSSWLGL